MWNSRICSPFTADNAGFALALHSGPHGASCLAETDRRDSARCSVRRRQPRAPGLCACLPVQAWVPESQLLDLKVNGLPGTGVTLLRKR